MRDRVSRPVEQLIDEILIIDCQSGSVKAMETLVLRWQERLWRYAYNLVSDTEAASDITQESWLGIIKGLRNLQDPASSRAWAYRITTNKSSDWIRKNGTFRRFRLDEIQNHRHKDEQDVGVKEPLEGLDIKKRVVIDLHYFEQLSVPEISAALKIPKGTVKSRLHAAKEELKKLWQQHF